MSIKWTKCPENIPTIIFHCKTLQSLPKFGFLVWKQTIWQPWVSASEEIRASQLCHRMSSRLAYKQYIQKGWFD
jgi:hypothetical protein